MHEWVARHSGPRIPPSASIIVGSSTSLENTTMLEMDKAGSSGTAGVEVLSDPSIEEDLEEESSSKKDLSERNN